MTNRFSRTYKAADKPQNKVVFRLEQNGSLSTDHIVLPRERNKLDSWVEPLMAKVTRFLGTPFYWKDIYQAIPVVPTVLTYIIV